ncbi:MAG: aminopeptidase P family N-terminal domain-containing protein, partial [Alphaproteobacteria bacterium]|nr:aminopeptidase P family N-terminal domain-containing protein [Alphaproteobacteria bacterium]
MNDASICRQTYQGDEALAGLLSKAGSQLTPDEVRSLLEGVLAAPEPTVEPDSWMQLVAADPSPALQAQLRALKAEIAARLDDGLDSTWTKDRLERFRAELQKRSLAGFIIARGDEHQGEYVAPRAQRLAWLTGFTGSAGQACVLLDAAAVFTDGRYTLQIREQVDTSLFETRHITEQPAGDWLAEHVKPGQRIGFDPRLATHDGIARLRTGIERAGGSLVVVDDNPVDAVWSGQKPPPLSPVLPHAETFAGKSHGEKRAELAGRLKKDGHAAAVLSDPASVAWLLNLRGGDVPHTPLPLSFAILGGDGSVSLFIDDRKLAPGLDRHLGNRV